MNEQGIRSKFTLTDSMDDLFVGGGTNVALCERHSEVKGIIMSIINRFKGELNYRDLTACMDHSCIQIKNTKIVIVASTEKMRGYEYGAKLFDARR